MSVAVKWNLEPPTEAMAETGNVKLAAGRRMWSSSVVWGGAEAQRGSDQGAPACGGPWAGRGRVGLCRQPAVGQHSQWTPFGLMRCRARCAAPNETRAVCQQSRRRRRASGQSGAGLPPQAIDQSLQQQQCPCHPARCPAATPHFLLCLLQPRMCRLLWHVDAQAARRWQCRAECNHASTGLSNATVCQKVWMQPLQCEAPTACPASSIMLRACEEQAPKRLQAPKLLRDEPLLHRRRGRARAHPGCSKLPHRKV